MYKQDLTFTFYKSPTNIWKVTRNLETESEYNDFINRWSKDGFELISEEPVKKLEEIYPKVLRLDLKSPGNKYFTLIERFESKKEFVRYCEEKLMQGFKVIGSTPYFKEDNNEN